jgi:hypothetical protein
LDGNPPPDALRATAAEQYHGPIGTDNLGSASFVAIYSVVPGGRIRNSPDGSQPKKKRTDRSASAITGAQ